MSGFPAMDPLIRLLDQGRIRPDDPALVLESGTVTYGAFTALVRRLAAAIRQDHEARLGGDPDYSHKDGPCVLIDAPQGLLAYAGLFATAMAGGFYSVLSPSAPPSRRAAIVGALDPTLILCEDGAASLWSGARRVLMPRDLPDGGLSEPEAPHNLAYVLFTSGSTGVPKGVMVPRSGLGAYLAWVDDAIAPRPGDRVAQHAGLAFDISGTDVYGALANGATLYPIVSQADRLLPGEAIRRLGITVWNSVPSVLTLMMTAGHLDAAHLSSVRLFNFCGEALASDAVEALWQAYPEAVIQNTYGPTEATIACTARRLVPGERDRVLRITAAMGGALPGSGVVLAGPDGPFRGEIVVTGAQLAAGYWQDPERTAKVFRPVTVDGVEVPGYYTGDLAEYLCDELFFRSRKDDQVKIAGHRIELQEVAAAIRKCGYLGCAVGMVEGTLTAFVEAHGMGGDQSAAAARMLKSALRDHLEDPVIPRRIIFRENLARNQNDKIDIQAMAEDASPDEMAE